MANLSNINNKFLVTTGGNVLINKTAANNATVGTQIMSTGDINPTVDGDTVARFNRLTNDGEIIRLQVNTSTVGSIGSTTSYLNGNLGIGGSPGQNLDVVKSGARFRLMDPVDGSTPQLNIGLWDGSNYRFEGDSNRPMFLTSYQGNIYLGTSGSTTMTIQSAKVGIGTTSPSRELDIQASSGWAEIALRGAAGAGGSLEFWTTTTKRAEIFADTEDIVFRNTASNAERMRIRASGTVGIGAAGFDSQMLTIAAGTLDGAIYATSTDANCFASFRDGNSSANIEYGAVGNDHVLRKDAAQYFIVNNVGDVYNYQSVNKANTFYGYAAGDYSAAGGSNTFMGYNCANNLSSGAANVGIGRDVYITTLTGSNNTAVGTNAMQQLTSGGNNVAVGKDAGKQLTSGSVNTFVGDSAGALATTVSSTTGVGFTALSSLTTGADNTAIGRAAAANLTTGAYVVAVGNWAADALTTNGVTIAIGYNALTSNTSGDNVAIGYTAAQLLTSGTNNTFLGNYAGRNATTSSYGTYLGRTAGQGVTTGAEPVFVGYDAGQQVTTGNYNTAIGTSAMTYGNGSTNVYVGWQCGFGVNGQSNSNNTAVGVQSMRSIQTGAQNTAMGRGALYHVTTGSYNVGIGWDAYQGVTTTQYNTGVGANTGVYQMGNYNTSIGYFSNYGVSGNSSGDYNTTMGYYSGAFNRGENNTFLGAIAGRYCSTGQRNTVVGSQAMDNNTMTGNNNTCIGFTAGQDLTTQADTTIVGSYAGSNLTTGEGQVIIGNGAMQNATTASGNTAIGKHALRNCTTGGSNIAIGYGAAEGGTVSGTHNVVIGDAAGYNLSGGSNNILIGQNAGRSGSTSPASLGSVTTNSNEIQMGNGSHSGAFIQVGWTTVSDARDKGQIKDVPHGLDFVSQLQPKSFEFKPDREIEETDGIERYGFLAQDVLELEGESPVVVNKNDENKLKMTNDYLVPILVNAIKELKAEIELLKSK